MVDSRYSRWQLAIFCLGTGWCLLVLPQLAEAQSYKQVPNAITDPRQVSSLRREVATIVRAGGALSAEDQRTLQNYYGLHVLAGMTHPEALRDPQRFPLWRKTIVGDLNMLGGSPQKHAFVRNLVYTLASRLVKDRGYSPAARYNALLLIGDLNERESQGSGGSMTPAAPYAPARQTLLEVLASDETQEMKIGAMIGLARHARLMAAAGTNPDANLARAMVDVLQQTDPGPGGTAEGLMWMQRLAVDALGDIGQSGAARLLQPIVSDASAPMMLRCAAADALARLDYRNADNLDQAALLKGLGQLATASLTAQIQGLQQHIKDNPPDMLATDRFRPEGEKKPEDPYVQRVRRQLKYQLICVGRALRTLQQATADATIKNAMTSLQSEITALLKELDAADLTPQTLFDKIGPPAVRLENAVKNA
jgi:hypothetical protein